MCFSIFSPFDWFAQLLGIVPPGGHIVFLGQSGLAMGSVIALQTWRILPLATVILMAGLSAIPAEVSDCAASNGHTVRQSTPGPIPFIKTTVVEAHDQGGTFGWR